MRELLRLADLLEGAKKARTPEQIRAALIAIVEHLYQKEFDKEINK